MRPARASPCGWRVAAALAAALLACATARGPGAPRPDPSADALRAEVLRRAPDLAAADVVVPFEVTEEQAAHARRTLRAAWTVAGRATLLSDAMFDPDGFNLRYAWGVTATARETLASGQGNCLSLASVFVGLARAAGLQAFYMDASEQVHETRFAEDGTVVSAGHISALVRNGFENVGLDFGARRRLEHYRILTDVEALSHFHNNRGYELMETAEARGEEPPWAEVARAFELATRISPELPSAWSNLGVARSRLGDRAGARAAYTEALRRDPALAAAHNNLGLLQLEDGDVPAALASFEAAARLAPEGPHIQYHLALARLRSGDAAGAMAAVRRAVALRAGYAEAEALLTRLRAERPHG